MRIAMVCVDDEYCEDFARTVAELLNLKFINFSNVFDEDLLDNDYAVVTRSTNLLNNVETIKLKHCLNGLDFVMSVPHDTFLSNENYLLFNQVLTICISIKEKDKIIKNIQKLIKKHCKICLNKNNSKLF